MATQYKLIVKENVTAATSTIALTAAAANTVVASVVGTDAGGQASVEVLVKKAAGSIIELAHKHITTTTPTELLTAPLALEATDVLYVRTSRTGTNFIVSYVEDTEAVAGQSIDVLNDVDTTTVLPSTGDVLTWDGNQWEPQAGGGGAVDSVNSQTGVVVLDMDDINDVNAPTPASNDVLKWTGAPTNAWQPVDWLSVIYGEFKQGGTTTVTNGGLTDSSLVLTDTEAKLKAGVTGFDITETSPGTIETIVATDATGSTAFTAVTLEGLTAANQASFTVENGTRFYFSDGTYTHMVKPNSGLTSSVINTLPDTTGTLALEADIPSTTSEITEGTNLYYTEARVSANSDVVANTAKRSYPIADENKLAGIATGATANSPDATLLDRANHTGTQTASTISDFSTSVDTRIGLARERYEFDEFKTDRNITMGSDVNQSSNLVCDVINDSVASRNNANAKNMLGWHLGSGVCVLQGMIDLQASLTASPGQPLWLGPSGTLSNTAPTTATEYSRILGYYVGTGQGGEVMVYFNPSPDWVQID